MPEGKVFLVAGLAFGDEGKGATVDFLARRHDAKLIVRYNGGPQAAHNVVTEDGRHHTFCQFGSGMFVSDVSTYLSRFMLVEPMSMVREEAAMREVGIQKAFKRLYVDHQCVVVTPFQRAVNRLMEWSRGDNRHGSCGRGIGQARSDYLQYGDKVLFFEDLLDQKKAKAKLKFIQHRSWAVVKEILDKIPDNNSTKAEIDFLGHDNSVDWVWGQYQKLPVNMVICSREVLSHCLASGTVVFEGAQGVLLDEKYGAPYNTWTDTTFKNADTLLDECGYTERPTRIGVLRTYFTRHGSGPLPTEDHRLKHKYPEPHNDDNGFQGNFRLGAFDFNLAKVALGHCGGVDQIALNHIDVAWPDNLQTQLDVPIGIAGYGLRANQRWDRLQIDEMYRRRERNFPKWLVS